MWNYSGLSPLQLKLIDRRVIDLSGEVDLDMAKYTREGLLRLKAEGSPNIEVRITSHGGVLIYGLDIYDMLRLYEGETRAVVFGIAGSIAAVFLQGCTWRCAGLNARILIHNVNGGGAPFTLDQLRKPKKMATLRQEAEAAQRRLYSILAKRTGKSTREIRATSGKDEEMTAVQARDYGLIDEVL
jgi:ATP-dependent Clp protease protease subunit